MIDKFLDDKIQAMRERQREFNAKMLKKGIDMTWKPRGYDQKKDSDSSGKEGMMSKSYWLQELL